MINKWQFTEGYGKQKMVNIIIHIRDNETGEVHSYPDKAGWDEENREPTFFFWEEGNYSCDCNRESAWHWAVGEEEFVEKGTCGTEIFDLNIENPATKEIVYREFE